MDTKYIIPYYFLISQALVQSGAFKSWKTKQYTTELEKFLTIQQKQSISQIDIDMANKRIETFKNFLQTQLPRVESLKKRISNQLKQTEGIYPQISKFLRIDQKSGEIGNILQLVQQGLTEISSHVSTLTTKADSPSAHLLELLDYEKYEIEAMIQTIVLKEKLIEKLNETRAQEKKLAKNKAEVNEKKKVLTHYFSTFQVQDEIQAREGLIKIICWKILDGIKDFKVMQRGLFISRMKEHNPISNVLP